MTNIKTITLTNLDDEGTQEHIVIENADGSFTTMLKSTYDAQQVEHLTSQLTDPMA